MEFSLTEEDKSLIEHAREFTREFISPRAVEYDRSGEFPMDICKEAFRQGLMNFHVPEKYGGKGYGILKGVLSMEEIFAGCTGIGTALFANGLSQFPLILHGTEEQKKEFLEPMTRKMIFSAYAVTEPDAGSDVNRISTAAKRDGDDYVINGTKWWITGGSVASWYFVLARVAEKRHTGFIVPADSPGISQGVKEINLGQHASNTVRVTFEDVRVPARYRVGEEGDGFKIAMNAFDMTRPIIATGANGITRTALNYGLDYSRRRRTFDKRLISNQGISFKLAEMATKLEAARMLTYKAAWQADNGQDNTLASAKAKWFASDVAMEAAVECAQILGGYGFSNEMPAEKLIRDAKIYQIYEGASEIQKMVIVGKLLRKKEVGVEL
ncbi:MAG: acyl-CoA dehydrogenase family protein [Leptospiraceae bacterium]|nr:acyl-CoA dehydrogenase family protein [Leptospiraceae bacterium]MCB1314997.1 acyl-CoA dehydrogenase family protein [Leptospiraceae bacterium]